MPFSLIVRAHRSAVQLLMHFYWPLEWSTHYFLLTVRWSIPFFFSPIEKDKILKYCTGVFQIFLNEQIGSFLMNKIRFLLKQSQEKSDNLRSQTMITLFMFNLSSICGGKTSSFCVPFGFLLPCLFQFQELYLCALNVKQTLISFCEISGEGEEVW